MVKVDGVEVNIDEKKEDETNNEIKEEPKKKGKIFGEPCVFIDIK